jgi:hypothetical protein
LLLLAALVVLSVVVQVLNSIGQAFSGPNGPLYVAGVVVLVVAAGGAVVYQRTAKRRAEARALAESAAEQQRIEEAEKLHAEQARAARKLARKKRRENLTARFGEEDAKKILSKEVWVGATMEMVIEALGEPAETSESVFKTKVKRVLKYEPLGGGRFGLKVKLEDDKVVGWDR